MSLYGCGQSSQAPQESEKKGGVEPKTEAPPGKSGEERQGETTMQVEGNMPISGTIGENVEGDSYDLRVLDYFTTDNYDYYSSLYSGEQQSGIAQVGKFVVVSYSVTNTSPQTIGPNVIAQLHARAGDKIEVYEQTDVVSPPHRMAADMYLDDLSPRQMIVSQFIFDVPTDVEPELVAITEEPQIGTVLDVGVVDLRDEDPQGPRPEELLALNHEYYNMGDYERVYELFAQESKNRVSEQVYTSLNRRDDEQGRGLTFPEYSFPSVEIEGDRATIETVRTYTTEEEEAQEQVTQEAVLEDEGWRIVMRDETIEFYLGGGEETTG